MGARLPPTRPSTRATARNSRRRGAPAQFHNRGEPAWLACRTGMQAASSAAAGLPPHRRQERASNRPRRRLGRLLARSILIDREQKGIRRETSVHWIMPVLCCIIHNGSRHAAGKVFRSAGGLYTLKGDANAVAGIAPNASDRRRFPAAVLAGLQIQTTPLPIRRCSTRAARALFE